MSDKFLNEVAAILDARGADYDRRHLAGFISAAQPSDDAPEDFADGWQEAGMRQLLHPLLEESSRPKHFDDGHIHTTPDGRHFRHGDGIEVDGDGEPLG